MGDSKQASKLGWIVEIILVSNIGILSSGILNTVVWDEYCIFHPDCMTLVQIGIKMIMDVWHD